MRYLLLMIALLLPSTVAAQEADQAREQILRLKKAVEHCDDFKPTEVVDEMLEDIDDELGFGTMIHYWQKRLGQNIWHVTVSHNGNGRWQMYGTDDYLIDSKRCAWVKLSHSSVASSPAGSMKLDSHGSSPRATKKRMLEELDYEPVSATKASHGLGRFVSSWELEEIESSSPYRIGKLVDAAEWNDGKPQAQKATYFEKRELSVIGIPRPKVWKNFGRYRLYRYDGGKRFRRGRAAVAVHDSKKKRHAWVLATPLPDAQGKLRFVGESDGLVILVTETHEIQNVFAVDLASGRAFVLDIAAETGIALEDGKLAIEAYDETGVIDLELVRKTIRPE